PQRRAVLAFYKPMSASHDHHTELEATMGKLKSYQEQVQEIIEKSINAVEEQHKALAQKPFELAEKVEAEAKSFSVESIRNAHKEYIDTLYTTLREWNKRLGNLAGDFIARVEQEQAAESV